MAQSYNLGHVVGAQGVSPSVAMSKVGGNLTITITDATGPHTETINTDSNILTAIGSYSSGDSVCNITINLEDGGDYTVKTYVSNKDIRISDVSYSNGVVTVSFNTQSSAGTISVEARKVV